MFILSKSKFFRFVYFWVVGGLRVLVVFGFEMEMMC